MASLRLGVVLGFDSELRSEIDGLRRALDSPQLSIVEPHITLSSPTNIATTELVSLLFSIFALASSQLDFEVEIGPAGSFRIDKFVSLLSVQSSFDLASLSEDVREVVGLGEPQYPFVPHVTLYDGATKEIVDGVDSLFGHYRRRCWFDSLVIFRMNKKGAYAKFAEPLFTPGYRSSNGGHSTKYFLLRGVGDLLAYLFEDDFYSSHVGEYGSHLMIEMPVGESFTVIGFHEDGWPSTFVTLRQLGSVVTLERIFVAESLRSLGLTRAILGAVAFFLVNRGARYLETPTIDCDERLVSVLVSLGATVLRRNGDPYSDRYSLNLLNL